MNGKITCIYSRFLVLCALLTIGKGNVIEDINCLFPVLSAEGSQRLPAFLQLCSMNWPLPIGNQIMILYSKSQL